MDLVWLEPGDPFPPASQAWDETQAAPGLLAGGGALDTRSLRSAYSQGIFPWFSKGQPILWWSPNPRMVLKPLDFRLHRSLRRTLARFVITPGCEVRFDSAFDEVISRCSESPREGQSGTWILPSMVQAYAALHREGFAHSIETWIDGRLAGGLYCVALGKAVFGESMFTRRPDCSKIALAALVAFCRAHNISQIDCQQNTRHLASLGAQEIARGSFIEQVAQHIAQPTPHWVFDPVYWSELLPPASPA